MKKLFIGKLSLSTTESSLRALFADYEPSSVKVITDKFSGDSRGFAFIEIDDNQRAAEAIRDLNGSELDGEIIVVNEARPKTEGSRDSGGHSGSGYRDSFKSGRSNYRSSSSSRY